MDAISSLPGVGEKSALRLALHLLRQPVDNVRHFTESIRLLRENVKYCRKCMMISDEEECSICRDTSRDHDTICVVENVRDVMSIEATGPLSFLTERLLHTQQPTNKTGGRAALLCRRFCFEG